MNVPSGLRRGMVAAFIVMLVPPAFAQTASICGEWNRVEPPVGTSTAVTDVAAVSANDAWAFAYYLGLVRWDGVAWSQFPVPLEDLTDWPTVWIEKLCPLETSQLFLAGLGDTGPFSNDQVLMFWDGAQWDHASLTLQPNIQGAPRNGAPNAVIANGADDAWILGIASGFGGGVNGSPVLTVHWDGSQLTEYITPGVGDRQNNLHDGVAIASNDAWAVGDYNSFGGTGGAFHGLTYHWDGTSWTHVSNPTQVIDSSHLRAVDGVASDDVWAAGDSPDGPLFMHWNGSQWTIVPSPATTGTIQKLVAIDSDDVWAVDSAWQFPGASKYYHWNGATWSVVLPPEIAGAEVVSRHGGLSAVGPCDVWAVGSIQFNGQLEPLIERLTAQVTRTPALELSARITKVAPNPFNPRVEIAFALDRSAPATLTIHDARGRLVRTLSQGSLQAGTHAVRWDGVDERGNSAASGTYFVSLRTGGSIDSRRMVLLK